MTYLALGDSIYSRKPNGTVAQLFARLCRRDGQNAWKLVEKTLDKRTMSDIHVDVVKCSPSLVTVTIGGNDFSQNAPVGEGIRVPVPTRPPRADAVDRQPLP